MRLTPQRQAVLDVLVASHDHPTAREVFQRVRRRRAGIGPATVYRTLSLLVASGQARLLALGDGTVARYDANLERHDHAVCAECGAAADIDACLPSATLAQLAAQTGYQLTGYHLEFRGRCPSCQARRGKVSAPAPRSTATE